MKNIEKIAIDTIVEKFATQNDEIVQAVISAKAAVEFAQTNFKKTASPLLASAKEAANVILVDQVSEEAIKYLEEKIAEIIKLPFKLQG